MTTNPHPPLKLAEIRTVDNPKLYLNNEWVYLGLQVSRDVDDRGQFTDELTYVFGKPAKE